MNDREPFFRLTPGPDFEGEVTPELLAWFDKLAEVLNHALEVTYREEFELTKTEFREAMMDHLVYGGPMPDVERIAARFATPIYLIAGPRGSPRVTGCAP
jgi:hypothetical protein